MFKSIGLNIDHPETFFVQQGKITKIVSFKPGDIMEMLMESAGVAYYQEIAENSKVVMKDKSDKLSITQERMKVSFGPKLKMLEKERARLAEYEHSRAIKEQLSERILAVKQYLAVKALSLNKESLIKLTKIITEEEKMQKHYEKQLDTLMKTPAIETNDTYELSKQIKDHEERITLKRKELVAVKNEKDNQDNDRNKKMKNIQEMRSKQAIREQSVNEAEALKGNTESVLARLKDRLTDIQQERHQMGLKVSGDNSEDPAQPLKNRIVKLGNDLLKSKDELQRTERQISATEESIAQGETGKRRMERELKELTAEENQLEKECQGFQSIVGLVLSRMLN